LAESSLLLPTASGSDRFARSSHPITAEVLFNGLVKIVARLVGLDREHAEDDIGGPIAFHISSRSILKILLSRQFMASGWEWSRAFLI
jgi:hypothetical protein